MDHSIGVPAFSIRARQALSKYIARPPLSLKKISIEENGVATVVSYTSDNEFFKAKSETFPLMRFFLELTQHIPPKGCQYIRRYGLYASRTKGKWPHQPYVMRLAPAEWKKQQQQADQDVQPYGAEAIYAVSDKESRSTWARLIAQVYEVDPLTCSQMRLADADSCRDHRAGGGPQDLAAPGEDRSFTARAGPNFVEVAICLLCA